jgi:hypothetical protein
MDAGGIPGEEGCGGGGGDCSFGGRAMAVPRTASALRTSALEFRASSIRRSTSDTLVPANSPGEQGIRRRTE